MEADDPFPALLREALSILDGLLERQARRVRLDPDEADDFGSSVRLRLLENDGAILRKFRGESSLKTYLAMVVVHLWRDYVVRERGRWRPSAAAARSGPLAITLERLTHRDGLPPHEAFERVRSLRLTDSGDLELARLMASLPPRSTLRPDAVPLESAEQLSAGPTPEEILAGKERRQAWEGFLQILGTALNQLPSEDRLILRMLFEDREDGKRVTVARIARVLGLEQKPLYRRIEMLLEGLRKTLEGEGIRSEDLMRMLQERREDPFDEPPDPGDWSPPSAPIAPRGARRPSDPESPPALSV
jgi:RNA polymerase sigma factor (sigma-70 family)